MTREEIHKLKIQHAEKLAAYRKKLYAHPQLRQLFLELTLKCNEACFHCGSSCGAARPDGLPAETYIDILDEVRESFDISRLMLCITGGEPLLRQDFFDILGYANEVGYKWGMTSNATLITPDDQRRLFSFIYEKRSEQMPVTYGCSHFVGFDYEREVRDWYFLCNAGIYTAGIMANGDVGACLDIERNQRTIQGNILETPFTKIWNERFEIFRQPLSGMCEGCKGCAYERYCAGGAHHSYDYENNQQRICMKGILFE